MTTEELVQWCVKKRIAVDGVYPLSEAEYSDIEDYIKQCENYAYEDGYYAGGGEL